MAKHTNQIDENHGPKMMEREKHTKKKRALGPTITLGGKGGGQLHDFFFIGYIYKGKTMEQYREIPSFVKYQLPRCVGQLFSKNGSYTLKV